MNATCARIVDNESLGKAVQEYRRDGLSIGTLNGVFDGLHQGHLYFISQAAQQTDILICGLNSDRSVRTLKGPGRPVFGEDARAGLLAALRWTDLVTIFDALDPIDLLRAVRPDVHSNGEEYGPDCIEAPVVREWGGRIHLVPRIGGHATTETLTRLRNSGG